MAPAFACRQLSKRYGATTALASVDLEVEPGELLGLLGPNGAGKSTLTKIACGLVRACSGHAEVEGAPAGSTRARSAIGYLAELFRFPDWLSADELLALHQSLAGSEGGPRERTELLELVELDHAQATRVDAMSKGMQQRLGIAQALVGQPRLLMLDEPTSALDPVGRRIVRDLLTRVRDRGVAVVLSSHLLSEVELVCDRVAILNGGRIVARRNARRAGSASRRRDPYRERAAQLPARRARGGARHRGGAGCAGRGDLRGADPLVDARGRLPRGGGRGQRAGARPRGGRRLTGALVVARYAMQECVRRRVIPVVLVLTVLFLALYTLGAEVAFREVDDFAGEDPLDEQVLTGSTLFGLAMFTTLFLGAVLAAFLTLGAVRGDAERGLLQPLVVRPVGRTSLLLGRFGGAAVVCAAYVAAVYTASLLITGITGGWWPDSPVLPGLGLVAAVLVIAALSLLGSVFLSATANGIAVLMLFGAGLAAGLLGQIGDALSVDTLETVAQVSAWLLPFEALYQDGLNALTEDVRGVTGVVVRLGPFGGAQEGGPLLWVWTLGYLGLVGFAARAAFARRDL